MQQHVNYLKGRDILRAYPLADEITSVDKCGKMGQVEYALGFMALFNPSQSKPLM